MNPADLIIGAVLVVLAAVYCWHHHPPRDLRDLARHREARAALRRVVRNANR